jgi:hypothetical protein
MISDWITRIRLRDVSTLSSSLTDGPLNIRRRRTGTILIPFRQVTWVMLSIVDSSNNIHWIHDQLEISTEICIINVSLTKTAHTVSI